MSWPSQDHNLTPETILWPQLDLYTTVWPHSDLLWTSWPRSDLAMQIPSPQDHPVIMIRPQFASKIHSITLRSSCTHNLTCKVACKRYSITCRSSCDSIRTVYDLTRLLVDLLTSHSYHTEPWFDLLMRIYHYLTSPRPRFDYPSQCSIVP